MPGSLGVAWGEPGFWGVVGSPCEGGGVVTTVWIGTGVTCCCCC